MTGLVAISARLSERVGGLDFPSAPCVYNPLEYAWRPHEAYLERWGAKAPRELLLVGMNPGPFGMAQTGVPFGDVTMVREFLGIEGPVGKPPHEHPKPSISSRIWSLDTTDSSYRTVTVCETGFASARSIPAWRSRCSSRPRLLLARRRPPASKTLLVTACSVDDIWA